MLGLLFCDGILLARANHRCEKANRHSSRISPRNATASISTLAFWKRISQMYVEEDERERELLEEGRRLERLISPDDGRRRLEEISVFRSTERERNGLYPGSRLHSSLQNRSYPGERHWSSPLKEEIDRPSLEENRVHWPFLYVAPAAFRTSPRFFND